jgi:hypothetical protein
MFSPTFMSASSFDISTPRLVVATPMNLEVACDRYACASLKLLIRSALVAF